MGERAEQPKVPAMQSIDGMAAEGGAVSKLALSRVFKQTLSDFFVGNHRDARGIGELLGDPAILFRHVALEERPDMVATDLRARLDQPEIEVGTLPAQRERDQAARQSSADNRKVTVNLACHDESLPVLVGSATHGARRLSPADESPVERSSSESV